MEEALFETAGASGRESMAFVATSGRGSVCTCARRPADANNARPAKAATDGNRVLELERKLAIVKKTPLPAEDPASG
jgi:hypothetical protein